MRSSVNCHSAVDIDDATFPPLPHPIKAGTISEPGGKQVGLVIKVVYTPEDGHPYQL